ncbi:MAG: nucleotidyltransferase domain-containing protein [Candidatus Woesearchaeota archaeon]
MIVPQNRKMINKEYLILEPFTREPWKALTFKEVKKLSSNNSDNYVHTTLKRLVKEEVLREQKVGNNIIYSLCKNIFALNTLGFIVEFKANKAKYLPHKNIQKLLDKIKTSYYTFIITGSYAKNKQKETSDVDVVIICDNKQPPNVVLSQIKLESELMVPEFHPYVFTQAEFYEMLINKEENYGKEIARNNLIITGGKEYYAILLEGIEHGFHG